MDFKEGDWLCPSCGDHQFARNASCRKCGAPKDEVAPATTSGRPIMRVASGQDLVFKDDWNCPQCGDFQFGRNASCRKCGAPRPAHAAGGQPAAAPVASDFKEGDWICVDCGDHQFARNTSCRRCGAARPGTAAVPSGHVVPPRAHLQRNAPTVVVADNAGFVEGDWMCLACGDHQFARNVSCRRCGAAKPSATGQLRHVPPVIEIDGTRYIAAPIQPTTAMSAVRPGNGRDFKAGDWKCPACGDHQFERNASCRKCGEPKPLAGNSGGPTIRGPAGVLLADIQARAAVAPSRGGTSSFMPGDWSCPDGGDHQFGRNEHCRKCGTARPDVPSRRLFVQQPIDEAWRLVVPQQELQRYAVRAERALSKVWHAPPGHGRPRPVAVPRAGILSTVHARWRARGGLHGGVQIRDPQKAFAAPQGGAC
ncbi:unnamed protein product [Durusdinium trenchii]|uniref:RanBP2-type domain-containing protein n=1 Tax=Durusdinium trenchii TaxID=1381693 RepID=A0ABP0PZ93_9DINO